MLWLAALPLIVAGCGPTGSTAYRLDGRRISTDPKLDQQWLTDKTICVGEEQKANMSAGFGDSGLAGALARAQAQRDVFSGCMAQRGYRIVWH
jgi:hypothetical protein